MGISAETIYFHQHFAGETGYRCCTQNGTRCQFKQVYYILTSTLFLLWKTKEINI